MINFDARFVDQNGAIYRPTASVHVVSSDEIVLSTGTGFRCVFLDLHGKIAVDIANNLVIDGWLERVFWEKDTKVLTLTDFTEDSALATLVIPDFLAHDSLIDVLAKRLRERGISVVLIVQNSHSKSDDTGAHISENDLRYEDFQQYWEELNFQGSARAYRRK